MSRLVVSGSCVSLSEAGEKTGPIGADILSKVRETTPGRLDSLLQVPSPDKYRGQLVGSSRDHLTIIESDVDFERFIQIRKGNVPSLKASLGKRDARQQVSPFPRVGISKMRQGGTETAPGFFKCCSLECALACQRQITDQFPAVAERSRFDQMVRDVSGTIVDGARIEPLDRVRDSGVQPLLPWDRDAGK